MTVKEKAMEINKSIIKINDDYENNKIDITEAIYKLLEYRRILSNMVEENNYDKLFVIPKMLYAIDCLMSEILLRDAGELDSKYNGNISFCIKNNTLKWTKE